MYACSLCWDLFVFNWLLSLHLCIYMNGKEQLRVICEKTLADDAAREDDPDLVAAQPKVFCECLFLSAHVHAQDVCINLS